MNFASINSVNRIAESLTVLFIFCLVLAVTYLVTRFIAGYQKSQMSQGNIRILETMRISQTKYLQLLQVGEVYLVIAVCKDSVTMLTTIEKEQLNFEILPEAEKPDFKEVLSQFLNQTPWNRQKSENQQKQEKNQGSLEEQKSQEVKERQLSLIHI